MFSPPPVGPTRATPRMFRGATHHDARWQWVMSHQGAEAVQERRHSGPRATSSQRLGVLDDSRQVAGQPPVGVVEEAGVAVVEEVANTPVDLDHTRSRKTSRQRRLRRVVMETDGRAERAALPVLAGLAVDDGGHVVGDPDEVVAREREPDESAAMPSRAPLGCEQASAALGWARD